MGRLPPPKISGKGSIFSKAAADIAGLGYGNRPSSDVYNSVNLLLFLNYLSINR